MKCYKNISELLTLKSAFEKEGRLLKPKDVSIIQNGAIVFDQKKIHWVGATKDIPKIYKKVPTKSLSGFVLTPELVDSHTHLVFAGNRSHEYGMRLNGASYEEIAQAGGGILHSAEQTRSASKKELFQLAKIRLKKIQSYGIGTIEIKTGYGLDSKTEIKMAEVIRDLKKEFPKIKIFCTFLGAHAIPKGHSSESYLKEIVIPTLLELHKKKLVDFVDIFHEKNYFSDSDLKTLAYECSMLNLKLRIHADELNDNNGAALAVQLEALSADHLLQISEASIKTMSKSDTVATLLPGTAFFLGKPLAPARKLLDAGVRVALASDFNPGSCHVDNLLLIANMSAMNLKLNQAELWSSITLNPAYSLGLKDQGALIEGLKPRFSLFKCKSVNEISYNWTENFSVKI